MRATQNILYLFVVGLVMLCFAEPGLRAQNERGAGMRPRITNQRVALVIGNADYSNSIGALKNPTNDATDMAAALRRLGFELVGGKAHLNLSKRQMVQLIREFGNRIQKGGLGVFYFAGHGVQIDKHNYLIPITDLLQYQEDAEYEAIDADTILREMEQAENSVNILVLDACRNNNLPKSKRSTAHGLAEPNRKPEGTLIAFSTADGQTASDNPVSRNGLFTQELLKRIETPGLPLDRLFRTVRNEVKRLSGNSQVPFLYQSLSEDVFLKTTEIAVAQVPPLTRPTPISIIPSSTKAPTIKPSAETAAQEALLELTHGRNELAAKLASDALRVNKNLALALAIRGWTRDFYNLGARDLKKSVQLEPQNALYRSFLARVYRNDPDTHNMALREAQQVLALISSPQTPLDYFARGLARKVILMLTLTDRSGDELNNMFMDFTRAVELNPQFAMAYYELGKSYLNTKLNVEKTYERAITSFTKAIAITPQFEFYRVRGMAYGAQRDFDKAIEDLNKAIEMARSVGSRTPNAICLRGQVYFEKGEYEKAVIDFAKVIEMEPENASGYLGRAKAYKKLGRTDFADADEKKGSKKSRYFDELSGNSFY